MTIVDGVGDWDRLFVPTVVARLVAAEQKYRGATGIERVEDAVRAARMLNSQFTHVAVARGLDAGRVRHFENRPGGLQQAYAKVDALLLGGCKGVPPIAKLFGELNFPG